MAAADTTNDAISRITNKLAHIVHIAHFHIYKKTKYLIISDTKPSKNKITNKNDKKISQMQFNQVFWIIQFLKQLKMPYKLSKFENVI